MPVNNYISLEEVFAKVIADLQIENDAIQLSNWIEWAAEAIKKIGAPQQYITRITGVRDQVGIEPIITISNYEGIVPCDLYMIKQLSFSVSKDGIYTTAVRHTGNFDIRQYSMNVMGSQGNLNSNTQVTFPNVISDKIEFVKDVFAESVSAAIQRLNTDPNLNNILDMAFTTDGSEITNKSWLTNIVYDYQAPYIRTNMKDGYCILAYKALLTDGNGYPMVPDDEDFKEAIKWYIDMQMSYPEFRKGTQGAYNVYTNARSGWNHFKNAAYGNLMMPQGEDDMQAIQNIWVRLIPMMNEHASGYRNSGYGEKVYKQ